jgi:hypothetical protein
MEHIGHKIQNKFHLETFKAQSKNLCYPSNFNNLRGFFSPYLTPHGKGMLDQLPPNLCHLQNWVHLTKGPLDTQPEESPPSQFQL